MIVVALAALALVISFPPFGLWPLAIVSFTILGQQLIKHRHSPRHCARITGLFTFLVSLGGFYWIAYTMHEFGGLPYVVAVPLTLLAFGILGLLSSFWGWLWAKSSRLLTTPTRLAAGLCVLLILQDSFDPRFFPWSAVMSVGQEPRLLASVAWLGTLGWRILFFALVSTLAVLEFSKHSRLQRFFLKVSLAALYFVPLFGIGELARRSLQKKFSARQPVALLQGNVGNYEKKLTKLGVQPTIEVVLGIHRNLIEQAAIEMAPDVEKGSEPWIFWPETSFPGRPTRSSRESALLMDWTSQLRGLQVVGGFESDSTGLDYNIVALFHERAGFTGRYQKHIRVPFGEYIPGEEWWPQAYQLLPSVNRFGRGTDWKSLPHPDPNGPVFVPLVCYEILFEGFVQKFVDLAEKQYPGRTLILVNPTNDSWYGPTSEPFQHALLAKWAAVRTGLPMVRPTNTGISLILAPWGEVMARGPRDASALIRGELPVPSVQKRLD
jgi:apolipoprotein N-acyltransferase